MSSTVACTYHFLSLFIALFPSFRLVYLAYNSMNGVPTCADPNLLNGILRDRWNFTGFVVSDYDASVEKGREGDHTSGSNSG